MWPFKPKLNFYVVLRQSPNWDTITIQEFEQQSKAFCRLIGRPENLVNEIVQLWNQSFGISFFETRQILKEIAQSSLKKVKNVKIIPIDQLEQMNSGIYLFIDDDDWIQPNITDFFTKQDINSFDGYRWGSVNFDGRKSELVVRRSFDETCFTNNYAVSSRYLNPQSLDSVYQHWIATGSFQQLHIKQFSNYLTVTNKHPASTVYLENSLADDFSPKRLITVVSEFNQKMQFLDTADLAELSWAKPYMQQTRDFYKKLLASTKG
ncbi:hypothetical protein [Candidatus Albibeggiatoa sp. nov. NOAA]|uniref:hypothetical protein n=1 Tax=Candidatus Albibeggiatoa sp. nov. NOAA TaxID=3162724 RepID=UPI0033042D53|nr:hypothetical protein [Thiotrichaceae bacterium]